MLLLHFGNIWHVLTSNQRSSNNIRSRIAQSSHPRAALQGNGSDLPGLGLHHEDVIQADVFSKSPLDSLVSLCLKALYYDICVRSYLNDKFKEDCDKVQDRQPMMGGTRMEGTQLTASGLVIHGSTSGGMFDEAFGRPGARKHAKTDGT